jgi:acetyl-CoA acetyltransferase family protein
MQQAIIVDAIRTPMGVAKPGAALAEVHPVDLLAQVLSALIERNRLDPNSVDDVICGCVSRAGEQADSPGRMAWLGAGLPEYVPSTTVDRKGGSGQQAVHFAAQGIMAGAYDIVIACGVESMSRVPRDAVYLGQDPHGSRVNARYAPGLVSRDIASELVNAHWNLTREELDTYSVRSHQLAHQARKSGAFAREIVPVCTPTGVVKHDETICADVTVQKLAALKPIACSEAMSTRFPLIRWRTTAGNSAQTTDGAAALLIVSERAAARLGLRARARFVGFDVCGDSPLAMLTAPIQSTGRVLQKTGLKISNIGHYEINEAFASVPLAWQREFEADPARLNPRGGAIALGHPLGASGVRLMTTMLHALEDTGGRYGLQSMSEAGGMANTTVIERL